MSEITILSEDVISKIAAGEVVERPASVVKELIENSLDAKATSIIIEVEDSGKKLIRIRDNGKGMNKEDAALSIIRHSTSKLFTAEDLFDITTLGFRGEALASISAVSQFTLITKQEGDVSGITFLIEGGSQIHQDEIGTDVGTTIEVRNIFFNTPARKKFLKSDAVELRHIIDVVTHYALLRNDVSFKLIHENHILLNSPAVDDQRNNIASIYGTAVAKDLLEVNYNIEGIAIKGFIGKPHQARNDKQQQILFVNNRWVRNNGITKAVYEGYHSLLFVGKHPIFVLHIQVDPKTIDVNIHPQKLDIKFEQRSKVQEAVQEAINKTLQEHKLFPVIDLEFTADQQKIESPADKEKGKYLFEKSSQTMLEINEAEAEYTSDETLTEPTSPIVPTPSTIEREKVEPVLPQPVVETKLEVQTSKLPELRLLGQIHKTFFVAETDGGAFFIDQHAAHERVLYERFMKQFAKGEVTIQTLLQGGVIECTPSEVVLVKENITFLGKMGFQVEHFGGNTYLLKTIPAVFGRLQPAETFHETLQMLSNQGKNKLGEVEEIIVTRMACRAAVMAGDELTNKQMDQILYELGQTKLPYTCPHGRPTLIKTTVDDLEKKFRRK